MAGRRLEYQFAKDSLLSLDAVFRVRWCIQRDNNTGRALWNNTSAPQRRW